MARFSLGLALLVLAPGIAAGPASATPAMTEHDYARASAFLRWNTRPLADFAPRRVTWLDDRRFWYAEQVGKGVQYRVMDATTGKSGAAFDQEALSAALAAASGRKVDFAESGISGLEYLKGGRVKVRWRAGEYVCELATGDPAESAGTARRDRCSKSEPAVATKMGKERGITAPDGKYAVFVRHWNLWLRDLAIGKERALTTDGAENYGYATQNAGWMRGGGAIVRWSPDSRKVATYRQDQRKVGDMYTLSARVGHPKLRRWKYPLPGDQHVFMLEPVVIDVASGKLLRLDMAPQQRLSTLCDKLACDHGDPGWSDVKWAPDSKTLALVSTSRDRKHEWFRVANAQTGAVRTIFEDSVQTYYESGRGKVNWQYLPATGEAIWFSERSNWGNLYLRDLQTGKLKHAITQGPGNVDQVLRIDRQRRVLWFVGNARTPGINPYFRQFFKVDIDTGKTTLLTPKAADHEISLSPDGRYFVDCYSTIAQPPVTVLRDSSDGHVIGTVGASDISRLTATGWKPPMVIKVKARDGKTELYGLMFKPTQFDPHKKYPVIDYIYPGPQTGSVSDFGFDSGISDHQAMAELGFIVVAINGMGTPWRSKSFHDVSYGDLGDNTLPDQVAGIKELARRHAWIDADRVGIWGHSGGGAATVSALFRYPDFFKVGWAESGNYDNRNYENDWGEKYQGLLVRNKDGTTNYDNQASQLLAKNLKGHLMLVHGAVDDNVPVGNAFLVVQALIDANKDFDLMIAPHDRHSYLGDAPYVTRRRWDYFVRHLLGATPPREFNLQFPRH